LQEPVPRSSYNVIDLFSGAGGLSLGAARAGFNVIGAVDVDPEAIRAHMCNFPNTVHLKTDLSNLSGQSLRLSFGLTKKDIVGLVGGPPCQGFSNMGRKATDDSRNELFVKFFRVVSEFLPVFFLAENVPGLMDERYSEIRKMAFSYVEGKYVILSPMTISAEQYGAPTTRKRIFFIGYLSERMRPLTNNSFRPPSDVEVVHVKDAFRGLRKRINPKWQKEEQGWRIVRVFGRGYYASRLHGHVPSGVGDPIALGRLKSESRASGFLGTVHSAKVAKRYAKVEAGKYDAVSKSFRLNQDGFCPTLRAGTGSDKGSFQAVRPLHPTENRVITPREAARLQGFPDWFQFSSTKWHSFRQIGSSVSPIVAEHVLQVIQKNLEI